MVLVACPESPDPGAARLCATVAAASPAIRVRTAIAARTMSPSRDERHPMEQRPERTPATSEAEAEGPERPAYRVEALVKGLRILALFDEQRPTWRVTDVVTATGLPMPTVYRMVMTLVAEGYLDALPNGEYRPAARTLTLGSAALRSLDLVAIATPKLQDLGERTGETVNLVVLSGDRVLYLVRLRNRDLVTANIQVGSTLPAVTSSVGKLLLAYLPERELVQRITPASFAEPHGPNAKRSLGQLREELRTIRKQGWAAQDEEAAHGLRSVAAPLRGADGVVLAGVNIAVLARDWPMERLTAELLPPLMRECAEISRLLTGTVLR
jgi:IclR family transcriptional regulator, pca regulon regulatory protein